MKKTGASFARGSSKQDYSTPREFINAVESRFGKIDFDLAASPENAITKRFYSPKSDSLVQDWSRLKGTLWLNPPFDRIEPWARKCAETDYRGGVRVLFLVPAAVGSNWFARFVHHKARVFLLNGRLSFDGKHPYPKDCLLAVYGLSSGYDVWRWKESLK